MPEVVNGNNILLGRGKIYFDRFDATGARTGELFLGNCPTFVRINANQDAVPQLMADSSEVLDVLAPSFGMAAFQTDHLDAKFLDGARSLRDHRVGVIGKADRPFKRNARL